MTELDRLLFQIAEKSRCEVVDLDTSTELPLIEAAIDQLTAERDELDGKIAKLRRLAEELQRKESLQIKSQAPN